MGDDSETRTVDILGSGRRKKFGLLLLGTLVLGLLVFKLFFPDYSDSPAKMRELALQGNLSFLRAVIRDYTAEQHKRPQSLDDLILAGYLKRIPKDPMTGRDDTWVIERSRDTKTPGIVNVRSGASSSSSKGTKYADW